jgi:hypothetical protein
MGVGGYVCNHLQYIQSGLFDLHLGEFAKMELKHMHTTAVLKCEIIFVFLVFINCITRLCHRNNTN